MNHLLDYDRLSNRYFVLRHGQSLANQRGIIVSHPENGLTGYGLSETGQSQVAEAMRAQTRLNGETLVLSSDFRRARETADIAHRQLEASVPINYEKGLRERDFGDFELGPDSDYAEVWQADRLDPDSSPGGVESANQVMARVSALVVNIENCYSGRSLLLVSHGDALQILQCAFARQDASQHRSLAHLETAEIRELLLSSLQD